MVPQHAHLMYVFSRVLVGQGELECPLNEGQCWLSISGNLGLLFVFQVNLGQHRFVFEVNLGQYRCVFEVNLFQHGFEFQLN